MFEDAADVSTILEDPFIRRLYDPCPDIDGMASVKKQALLGLATRYLEPGEVYYEVGSYQGKSLVSALHGREQPPRAYACDNFSEFTESNHLSLLLSSIARYGLSEAVTLLKGDFRSMTSRTRIPEPVGVYFYDGAHDYESQYQAIRVIEPLLAPVALVIVDDWRFAPDSQSHAARATRDAIERSSRVWRTLYELGARYNGDHAMWWNGVGVFVSTQASRSP